MLIVKEEKYPVLAGVELPRNVDRPSDTAAPDDISVDRLRNRVEILK
jgi:hypothetical protein